MAIPAEIVLVPVTGTYLRSDGTPYSGTVTYAPGTQYLRIPGTTSKETIVPPTIVQALNAAGQTAVSLWSTDNTAISPTGWQWQVTVKLTGTDTRTLTFPLDVPGSAASGGIDLSTIDEGVAASASNGTTSFVTVAGVDAAVAAYLQANPTGGTGVSMTQVNNAITANNATLYGTPTPTLTTFRALQDAISGNTTSINNLTLQVNAKAAATTWKSTAVTAAYTAVPGDGIDADATAATFTITLPAGPADGASVRVKKADTTSNAVHIIASGTDSFLNVGTASSSDLLRPGQTKQFTYIQATSVWIVQDMPALADLLNTYLPTNYAPATGSPNYASNSAAFKVLLVESGDAITAGMDLRPNGVAVPAALTVNAFGVEQDTPATGSQTWRLVEFKADSTTTTIGTVTVPGNTRAAVVGSLNYSVAATSRLLVQNTSVAGSYNGQGVTGRIALGAGSSITLPTAPATPTGLTASNGSSAVNLSWGSVTGATSYLVYVDGVPAGPPTTGTSYSYPTSSGSSHTFQVAALCPGAMSALSASVNGGSYTSYSYFSQTDGAPVGWSVYLAATGNGQAVTVASNIYHATSGNLANSTTAPNSSDPVGATPALDGSTHTLYDWNGQSALDTSNSIQDIYLSANALTSGAWTFTNGVQFEITSSQCRIAIKAASYNSGSIYYPTYSTTPGATSQYATFPFTWNANGTNYYGVRARVIDPGDGTLTAQLYMGTTAQQAAGTLPLVLAATLPSAFKTALAPGYAFHRQLGRQSLGTSENEGSKWQSLTITPTSAAGA